MKSTEELAKPSESAFDPVEYILLLIVVVALAIMFSETVSAAIAPQPWLIALIGN